MRAEADSNRGLSAYQPNALPLGQTGSCRLRQSADLVITGLPSFTENKITYMCLLKDTDNYDETHLLLQLTSFVQHESVWMILVIFVT